MLYEVRQNVWNDWGKYLLEWFWCVSVLYEDPQHKKKNIRVIMMCERALDSTSERLSSLEFNGIQRNPQRFQDRKNDQDCRSLEESSIANSNLQTCQRHRNWEGKKILPNYHNDHELNRRCLDQPVLLARHDNSAISRTKSQQGRRGATL